MPWRVAAAPLGAPAVAPTGSARPKAEAGANAELKQIEFTL